MKTLCTEWLPASKGYSLCMGRFERLRFLVRTVPRGTALSVFLYSLRAGFRFRFWFPRSSFASNSVEKRF